MKAGTIFNDGSRSFLKLKTTYASGLKMNCFHNCAPELGSNLPFNAVDFEGCPAKCPDWCEFVLGKI